MLALVAPYDVHRRFFADALTAPNPDPGPAAAEVVESGQSPVKRRTTGRIPACWSRCSAGGAPCRTVPGHEHREPAAFSAAWVAQIRRRGGTLIVEAGTRTGKSLAYLVRPSLVPCAITNAWSSPPTRTRCRSS